MHTCTDIHMYIHILTRVLTHTCTHIYTHSPQLRSFATYLECRGPPPFIVDESSSAGGNLTPAVIRPLVGIDMSLSERKGCRKAGVDVSVCDWVCAHKHNYLLSNITNRMLHLS